NISRYDGQPVPDLIRHRLKNLSRKSKRGVLFLSHLELLNAEQQDQMLSGWQQGALRLIAASLDQPVSNRWSAASVSTLNIPALRQRQEDIPLLAEHFIRKVARERRIRQKSL